MPVPTTQPQRVAVASVGRMPASAKACAAATSAKRCERLANLSSLRSPTARSSSASSRPLTSAAMRTGKPLASKLAMRAAPLRPASSAAQVLATSLPTGVTRPRPGDGDLDAAARHVASFGVTSMRALATVLSSLRAETLRRARCASMSCSTTSSCNCAPGAVNERIFT